MENNFFIPRQNFKFHSYLDPSIRSLKNIPNFYKEMRANGQNFCLSFLTISDSFPVFMV